MYAQTEHVCTQTSETENDTPLQQARFITPSKP